jgi:6-phosphogluconolactonase
VAHWVYFSIAGENRLARYAMDSDSGALDHDGDVTVTGSPGPLTTNAEQTLLYAGLRSSREIATYAIDPGSGNLSLVGTATLDADPCYIALDNTGGYLLSSYYGAGKITVHAVGSDGTLRQELVEDIPTAERAHCIQTDATNRLVFVPHTAGPNLIFQFAFDGASGKLTPNATPTVSPPAGEGPRHFCFHPTLDMLYFSNEQGCSITAYRLDRAAGALTRDHCLPTLPDDFTDSNSCAQIHMTPDGRNVYVTNRGHDSIAAFSVDPTTGALAVTGHYASEETPRTFGIDPSGSFLYACGQGTGHVAAYRIDAASGALDPIARYDVGKNPMWVQFLTL